MQKIIPALAGVLAIGFFACGDDEDCGMPVPGVPACIQEKFDGFEADTTTAPLGVYRTLVGGEAHFWFNTGAITFDGSEYILSAECDTVCSYCFCAPLPTCLNDFPGYLDEDWELVWEP